MLLAARPDLRCSHLGTVITVILVALRDTGLSTCAQIEHTGDVLKVSQTQPRNGAFR
jgi:hypothetical protein